MQKATLLVTAQPISTQNLAWLVTDNNISRVRKKRILQGEKIYPPVACLDLISMEEGLKTIPLEKHLTQKATWNFVKDPGICTQVQGPLFSSDPLLNWSCLDFVVSSPISKAH